MKSLDALAAALLEDLGQRCSIRVDRDLKTVADRCRSEGDQFLTITLAQFGKALLRAVEQGVITPSTVTHFRWRRGLPVFLQGFLERIFDRQTGLVLDVPDPDALQGVLQFTGAWAKIQEPCTPERERAAFESYVETDRDLGITADGWNNAHVRAFATSFAKLFAGPLTSMDRAVYYGEVRPRFSGGATAEKLSANARWEISEWTERLDAVFPLMDYAFPNHSWWREAQDVTVLAPWDERPVRVTSVPKTQTTPRIIAVEPSYMNFMQQALLALFVEHVDGDRACGPILGWSSQEPNRRLAHKASVDGAHATLDLSEASDRVSARLVWAALERFPSLRDAVWATRSAFADVPFVGEILLHKFASMGSALCFPIEGMVFTTIALMGIAKVRRLAVTPSLLTQFKGELRVYGDDMIVPADCFESVIEHLEAYGLKVNVHKSFAVSRFRESCGGDYFGGQDVTIVKVRRRLAGNRPDAESVASTVALRNHMYIRGMERTVAYLDACLLRVIRLRTAPVGTDALCLWSYTPQPVKFEPTTQRAYYSVHRLRPVLPKDELHGRGALMKFFLKTGDKPIRDPNHLSRAGRPLTVSITSAKAYL